MNIISQFFNYSFKSCFKSCLKLVKLFKLANCQICKKPTPLLENKFMGIICSECKVLFEKIKTKCLCCATLISKNTICGSCCKKQPYFDKIYVDYIYQEPISLLIQEFKYKQKIFWRKYFAVMMFDSLTSIDYGINYPDLLIPVPMHHSKLKNRGFNHSWEITKYLSKLTKIKCTNKLLVKQNITASQAGSRVNNRKNQQRNSFAIQDISFINNYKHILIVDDIITTGSTLNEMARILKISGAQKVEAICLARAIMVN